VGPVHENGASGESGQPWAISNSCPVFVLPVAPCEHLAPVACWNPHSLDAQQLRLNGEGQP
jgi:hypothetical protein